MLDSWAQTAGEYDGMKLRKLLHVRNLSLGGPRVQMV